MQKGVEGSGPDAIPMMLQLFHHREAKDGLVGCMDEHMNPNETDEESPLEIRHLINIPLCNLNRISIV